jgi:hypothetical protein
MLDYETDDFSSFSDEEILEIIDEHYYTLATTGVDALGNLCDDINAGVWLSVHGIEEDRIGRIGAQWTQNLLSKGQMNVTAIDWHKANHPTAGLRKK